MRDIIGTEYGDANLDGKVNSSDAAILGGSFGTQTGATWSMNDANGDGKVNSSDAAIMGGNFGFGQNATAALLEAQSTGRASVPEPSGMFHISVCLFVAPPFLRRRQRVLLLLQ